jgi:hypothetical protein
MEKKTGVIKSISVKQQGKNAFCLEGSPQWYNGYSMNDAKKGDAVEFDLEVNGDWHNFSNLKVVDVSGGQGGAPEVRMPQAHSEKERSIMAQTFTKCYYYGNKANNQEEILRVYNWFLNHL